MNGVVETIRSGVEKQVRTIKKAITTPMGPFETIDELVRNTRSNIKQITSKVVGRIIR